MNHPIRVLISAVSSVAGLLMAAGAAAAPITFSDLSGANGAAFSTYSEGGFDVAATRGAWVEAQLFGNPVPDIFSLSTTAQISVTEADSGRFTFSDVDLGLAGGSNVRYRIVGMLGSATVFSQRGSLTGVSFHNVLSGSSLEIDRLLITMVKAGATSYNIDNINVASTSAVPEASGALLMALGLVGVAVFRPKTRG